MTTPTTLLRESLIEAHQRNDLLGFLPSWTKETTPAAQPVILLGSNVLAEIVIRAVRLQNVRVLGVVDDFKIGQTVEGVTCISSVDFLRLVQRVPEVVCVNVARWDLSRRYFASLSREFSFRLLTFEQGVRWFRLETIDVRVRDWGPVIQARLDEFLALENRLCDDFSRATLYSVLLFHFTTDPEFYLHIARPYETLYFRSGFFRLGQAEAFVDCGAAIGESATHFMGLTGEKFQRASLIEPDRNNIPKLHAFRQSYAGSPIFDQIEIHEKALGAKAGRVPFTHLGGHGGSVKDDGTGDEVPIDALDNLVKFEPTFLKLDIEGYELEALRGASGLIAGARPKIAVSAYHRATDLIDLVDCVTKLNPNYRLGLQHHNLERWDTCLYFF